MLALITLPPRAAAALLPDLANSPDAIRMQAVRLLSNDEAKAREAELRLACAGPRALDAIDAARLTSRRGGKARLRRLLDLALRTTVTEADLRARPRLFALVRADLEGASKLADSLARCRQVGALYTSEGAGTSLSGDVRLIAYGGSAIPAAERLLRAPQIMGRAVGIQVIRYALAAVAIDSLASLMSDPAEFEVDQGDYMSGATIGSFAAGVARGLSGAWDGGDGLEAPIRVAYEDGGRYDASELINGIRQMSVAMGGDSASSLTARSWDEWWDRARPAWQDWWTLSAGGERPPDREEWLNAERAYEGFRLEREGARDGTSRFELQGPANTRVELIAVAAANGDTTVLASGTPPLRVVVPEDGLLIRARFADGRPWERALVGMTGMHFRMILLDSPRQPGQRLR